MKGENGIVDMRVRGRRCCKRGEAWTEGLNGMGGCY